MFLAESSSRILMMEVFTTKLYEIKESIMPQSVKLSNLSSRLPSLIHWMHNEKGILPMKTIQKWSYWVSQGSVLVSKILKDGSKTL